ncbi:hypothetical protein [Celerinatantimonas sp. MCCC 1A17872]|uniref:hypothetical protein n=1 Tax=Celerinatantimonas sp. MCCC 1A17872 TaxID=3177514 RepID=UPI0038CB21C9
MNIKPNELLNQWSTWRGLALTAASVLGAPAAAIAAGGHVLSLVPSIVTAGIGLFDAFRDENKTAKPQVNEPDAAKEQGASKGK